MHYKTAEPAEPARTARTAATSVAGAFSAALVLASCAMLGYPAPGASPSPTAPAVTPTPDPQAALEEDVCGDLGGSKVATLTAAAATDSAPALQGEHTRNNVTLPASASARAGFLKLESTEQGEWGLFLTKNVPVKITDATGKAVAISGTRTTFAKCQELKAQHTATLKVGVHYLELGPTSESDLAIVVEGGEEEH